MNKLNTAADGEMTLRSSCGIRPNYLGAAADRCLAGRLVSSWKETQFGLWWTTSSYSLASLLTTSRVLSGKRLYHTETPRILGIPSGSFSFWKPYYVPFFRAALRSWHANATAWSPLSCVLPRMQNRVRFLRKLVCVLFIVSSYLFACLLFTVYNIQLFPC